MAIMRAKGKEQRAKSKGDYRQLLIRNPQSLRPTLFGLCPLLFALTSDLQVAAALFRCAETQPDHRHC